MPKEILVEPAKRESKDRGKKIFCKEMGQEEQMLVTQVMSIKDSRKIVHL